VRSLTTLIRDKLGDRPRRDVAIALTWVACESGSHTPARVLEAGPWWQAVGRFDDTAKRSPRPEEACRTCGRWMHAADAACPSPTSRPPERDPSKHAAGVDMLRAAINRLSEED
jgi:hypothetical protein